MSKSKPTYRIPSPTRIFKSLLTLGGLFLAGLILLELGLRVSGKGYDTKVLIKGASGRLEANPNFSRRVLKPGTVVPLDFAPSPAPPSPGKEILIIGDSSARGSHASAYSFGHMLEQMLGNTHRVSLLSFPAADSHVLRLLAKETADLADIVIIYGGHYEYMGPFSGTRPLSDELQTPEQVQAHLSFQSSRARQFFQRLAYSDLGTVYTGIHTFRTSQVSARKRDRERHQSILRENFAALGQDLKRQGKRVIFCVPAVNVRDAAPFNSNYGKSLTDEQKTTMHQLMRAGGYNFQAGKEQLAVNQLSTALTLDDDFAQPHYILAKILESKGQTGLARAHYERALKQDGIPLRAGAGLRKAVQQAAAESEVELVDLHQLFAAASTDQIPGASWFHDHIHLNFKGHTMVATALYEHLTGQRYAESMTAERMQVAPAHEHAVQRAFLFDQSRPPFNYRYGNHIVVNELRKSLNAQTNLTHTALTAVTSHPRDAILAKIDAKMTGEAPLTCLPDIQALLKTNPYDTAAQIQLSRLYRLTGKKPFPKHQIKLSKKYNKSPAILVELAEAYGQAVDPRNALKTYEKILSMDEANISAFRGAAALLTHQGRYGEAIQGLTRALQHESDNPGIHEQAAELYGRAKNYPMAMQHLKRALEVDPNRETALAMVKLYQSSGNEEARKLNNEGSALMGKGQYAEALTKFNYALKVLPDAPVAINNLAYLLATCPDDKMRNGAEAVKLAQHLVAFAKDAPQPGYRATLAAAYAEIGDFEAAVETIIQAVGDAEALGQDGSVKQFLDIMSSYKDGEPYRHVANEAN